MDHFKGGASRTSAEINRIKILITQGISELDDILNNVDAESADVLGALMSIDDVIRAVRDARDDLHYILMEWDPVIAQWKGLEMVRSQEIDKSLSATYKLLAKRFDTGKSIVTKRGFQQSGQPAKSKVDDKPTK